MLPTHTPKWQGLKEHVQSRDGFVLDKYSSLSSLLSVAIVVLFVAIVSSFAITKYISEDTTVLTEGKANVLNAIAEEERKSEYLTRYTEAYQHENIYASYLHKILAIKTKCCLGEVVFDNNSIKVCVYAEKEKDFKKFYEALSKTNTVDSVENDGYVIISDVNMQRYVLNVSI